MKRGKSNSGDRQRPVATEARPEAAGVRREQSGGDERLAGEALLDKVAIARRLGVKPRTISDWVTQGRLPAYRLGPYLRFKWSDVEAHLDRTCRVTSEGSGE